MNLLPYFSLRFFCNFAKNLERNILLTSCIAKHIGCRVRHIGESRWARISIHSCAVMRYVCYCAYRCQSRIQNVVCGRLWGVSRFWGHTVSSGVAYIKMTNELVIATLVLASIPDNKFFMQWETVKT